MSTGPIVIEQAFGRPPSDVWAAITDPVQMRQWYFEMIADFRAEVGFETGFVVHSDGQDYLHRWCVTEVVPGEHIAYRWRYGDDPGDSAVTWSLAPGSAGTLLVFHHQGHETLLASRGDASARHDAFLAAWRFLIQDSLVEFLAR